jgi:hypothetical protein
VNPEAIAEPATSPVISIARLTANALIGFLNEKPSPCPILTVMVSPYLYLKIPWLQPKQDCLCGIQHSLAPCFYKRVCVRQGKRGAKYKISKQWFIDEVSILFFHYFAITVIPV